MWQCPECGRKFTRNKQSHNCLQYSLDDIFFGKTEKARALYDALFSAISEFGEIDVYVGKYNLTIRRLTTFLSVMVEKDHLTLVFISSEPVDEFPVYQHHQHSAHRFSNVVKVEAFEEIDAQLLRWLRQAWELAV